MSIETDDDRRLFVEEDDFAVPVAWTSAGGTVTFPAIFDAEYQLLTPQFVDGGVEGSTPQLTACSSDIPEDAEQGDAVVVKGKSYSAVEFKPDGTGMSVIRLQEA